MRSSSVDDVSSKGVLMLRERYCFCKRRAALKISHLVKNPNRVYVKCEMDKCGYWGWVKAEDGEKEGDGEDSIDSSHRPHIEWKDIAELCDRMARVETKIDMIQRDVEGMKRQMEGTK